MVQLAHRGLVAVSLVSLACGRSEQAPPSGTKPREQCFTTHDRTSATAQLVIERRGLQGEGPTWGAVLEVVVRARATVGQEWSRPSPVGFGVAHDARYAGAPTWYLVDDEADGATFCTGSPQLLRDVSADYEQLNAAARRLERALDQAGEYLE
jgi:hypothetical protein